MVTHGMSLGAASLRAPAGGRSGGGGGGPGTTGAAGGVDGVPAISDEFPLPLNSRECLEETLDPHTITHGFREFAAGIQVRTFILLYALRVFWHAGLTVVVGIFLSVTLRQELDETKLSLVVESKLWSPQMLQNLHQAFRHGLRDFKAAQSQRRKDVGSCPLNTQ